jgi:chromosome segregation ATPase
MVFMKTLFDDNQHGEQLNTMKKESTSLDKFKTLEDKIAATIERVKSLKEEKILMERRIKELERLLDEKNQEVEQMRSEKNVVKSQIETLLDELETLDAE